MQSDGASEFGIGAPVRRIEDARLLTGCGHYVPHVLLLVQNARDAVMPRAGFQMNLWLS